MITDYASLQTAVLSRINRANDSEAILNCPLWVQLAEDELRMVMSRMQIRQAETKEDAYSISTEYTTLPTGFISVREIRLATSPPKELDYIPPQSVDRYKNLTGSVGTPDFYTIQGNKLRVISPPDSTYTASFTYYSLPSLSVSATTNWLLDTHPKVYYKAVLSEAYDFYEAYDKKTVQLQDVDRMLTELEITEEQGAAASGLRQRVDSGCP